TVTTGTATTTSKQQASKVVLKGILRKKNEDEKPSILQIDVEQFTVATDNKQNVLLEPGAQLLVESRGAFDEYRLASGAIVPAEAKAWVRMILGDRGGLQSDEGS